MNVVMIDDAYNGISILNQLEHASSKRIGAERRDGLCRDAVLC